MTITSPHNPHLKELRRLTAGTSVSAAGAFLRRGRGSDRRRRARRVAGREGYRVAGSELGGARFTDVAPEALAAVSALGSGTRAIGVYEQRWLDAPAGPLCVYLHGVRDPGNVGTVLRGALAFGASCVALGPGLRRSVLAQGRAREHGRDLRGRARAREATCSRAAG